MPKISNAAIPLVLFALMSGAALAADTAGLPDGTFASTEEGCKQLETTPAAALKDFDFQIFDKDGVTSTDTKCSFVTATKRDDKSWLATAFCEQQDFSYPDVASIEMLDGGRLRITMLTDIQSASPTDVEVPPDTDGAGQDDLAGGAGDDQSPPDTTDQGSQDEVAGDTTDQAEPTGVFTQCAKVAH